MYKSIAQELLGDRAAKLKNARSACSAVEKYLSSKGGCRLSPALSHSA